MAITCKHMNRERHRVRSGLLRKSYLKLHLSRSVIVAKRAVASFCQTAQKLSYLPFVLRDIWVLHQCMEFCTNVRCRQWMPSLCTSRIPISVFPCQSVASHEGHNILFLFKSKDLPDAIEKGTTADAPIHRELPTRAPQSEENKPLRKPPGFPKKNCSLATTAIDRSAGSEVNP
uniref:Uncharacterized protein n=1 Tax=Parascaris univalens TaxID=6257 RepID=A0A915A1F7_PARUN